MHRIVTRHGGRAWATGSPGAGATVSFTLGPDTVPADGAAPAPEAAGRSPGQQPQPATA